MPWAKTIPKTLNPNLSLTNPLSRRLQSLLLSPPTMADVVQYRLERIADELDELERKGLFTHTEIAEIAKKRRNFEYRIKRPSPIKQDYLDYIEYEKTFDVLRRLRRKSVSRERERKGKKKLKRSVWDDAGVMKILKLYQLAVTRFKGDLGIWFQYLDYCRERGHGMMKKVLAELIRFHPKVPSVWIYAAAWQFDHNLNISAARALMQSGLRACPNSEDLWVEYLRMELTYFNKLKARKAILGEDKGTLTRGQEDTQEKEWRDENSDLFMALDDGKENANGSNEPEKADVFQEQASGLLQAVYSESIQALPSSMNLRKRFLQILDDLDLAHADRLREEIINSMKRDFAKEPEYWDWLARFQVNDLNSTDKMNKKDMPAQLDKAIGVYEEALEVVPSPELFSLYTKFWMDLISPDREGSPLSEISDRGAELSPHLLKVYEKAESMGCLVENLACQYVSVYMQLGKVEEARKLAEKLCEGKHSGAIKLLVLRLSIEVKWITEKSTSSKEDLHSSFELVRNILAKVPISEADSLWLRSMKFFANNRKQFNKLVKTFEAGLARGSEGGSSVSSAIVSWIVEKDGIQQARDMYKRFLALPRPSLALYRTCIELESKLAFAGDKDGLANVRKLYISALETYSEDVELWRDYFHLENKVGTSETANLVYWRAGKALQDSTKLLVLTQELQSVS